MATMIGVVGAVVMWSKHGRKGGPNTKYVAVRLEASKDTAKLFEELTQLHGKRVKAVITAEQTELGGKIKG